MARASFKMDSGWRRYNAATLPANFRREFARRRKQALDRAAKELVISVYSSDDAWRSRFERSAALSSQLRGGASRGIIRRAIVTRNLSDTELFLGVPSTSQFYDEAVTVHEGATIKVTDKMRSMFAVLAQVSRGEMQPSELEGRAAELYQLSTGPWYPLSESTQAIKIPARPFMKPIFESPAGRERAKQIMIQAVDETFRALAAK